MTYQKLGYDKHLCARIRKYFCGLLDMWVSRWGGAIIKMLYLRSKLISLLKRTGILRTVRLILFVCLFVCMYVCLFYFSRLVQILLSETKLFSKKEQPWNELDFTWIWLFLVKQTFIAQHHHHLGSLLDSWVQSIFSPIMTFLSWKLL